jgi:phosphocarrier protein HPr
MISRQVTIANQVGLHARPAALFVNEAQKYEADILVEFEAHHANAKSLLGIMGLGVGGGMEILISIDGIDEQEAMTGLLKLIETQFDQ